MKTLGSKLRQKEFTYLRVDSIKILINTVKPGTLHLRENTRRESAKADS